MSHPLGENGEMRSLRLKRSPKGEKVYEGVYEYRSKGRLYSEEEFMVFRHQSGFALSFFSQMDCRVATGEIFRVYVDYVVSKDFMPQKVLIEKVLGERQSSELYQYDQVKSCINYFFISPDQRNHLTIPVTSRFHIGTPTMVTSMLFIKNRPGDVREKDFHVLFGSQNDWEFSKAPSAKSLIIQRSNHGTSSFRVGDEIISVPVFNIYENVDEGIVSKDMPKLEVYMSRHLNIPYAIKGNDGLEVEITKFQNLIKE